MQTAVAAFAVILLGIGGVVHHSRAQSTTSVAPEGPPAQDTRTVGSPPALEGRWLAVTTIGTRNSTSLWEVVRNPDGVVLTERHVVLPEALRRNAERSDWNPSAAELETIAAAWSTLPAEPRAIVRIEHEIFGRDGFTDEVKKEPMTAGALWVVRQKYIFAPGRSRPVQEVRLLAGAQEDPAGYRGAFLSVVVARVPVPVPIKIPGTFRVIRVSPTSRSVWSRIADVFRGCN